MYFPFMHWHVCHTHGWNNISNLFGPRTCVDESPFSSYFHYKCRVFLIVLKNLFLISHPRPFILLLWSYFKEYVLRFSQGSSHLSSSITSWVRSWLHLSFWLRVPWQIQVVAGYSMVAEDRAFQRWPKASCQSQNVLRLRMSQRVRW